MDGDISKQRTHNYWHQIKGSVVFQTVGMGASFLTIPLMIRYLGEEQFGVWSTLLTIMSWIVFFDLGVGNGLRNKIAETLANNQRTEASSYIASAYSLIAIFSIFLYISIYIFAPFVPWQVVFNIQSISQEILEHIVQIAAFFIILNFWIGLIRALLGAVQKTSIIALGQLVANILVLLLVLFLIKMTDASISYLAFVYGLSIVTANLLISIYFYCKNIDLLPKPYLDTLHIRPLLAVGLQFFIIQLAVLVVFTTDKILITQLFGPKYVTPYDVVFKLFSIITFTHALIITPLWSAYTDAYHQGDIAWIKATLRMQLIYFLYLCIAVVTMVLVAKQIISVWIGQDLEVSRALIVTMGSFVAISMWNNIFAYLVNGTGRIKVQLYTAVIAMILNIPLSITLVKYFNLGLYGILLGTCISLILAAIALPIQVYHMFYATK